MPCGFSCLPRESPLPRVSSLCVFGPCPELRQGQERWLGGRSPARHHGSLGWLGEQGEDGVPYLRAVRAPVCPAGRGGWGRPRALGSCPCARSHC